MQAPTAGRCDVARSAVVYSRDYVCIAPFAVASWFKAATHPRRACRQQAFVAAAYAGDAGCVRWMLDVGCAGANDADEPGWTALLAASEAGHLEIALLLIEAGATVDGAAWDGTTPLFLASQAGKMGLVKALLEAKATVTQATDDGATPLYVAAQNAHVEVVGALLAAGAAVNQAMLDGATPVYIASQGGHTATLKLLLEKGGNVNQARDIGCAPVYIASYKGHTAALKLLLANGGNVNQARDNGCTPVFIASYKGHAAALTLLIENGGNANQANNNGCTPVYIASQKGHAAALKLLLKAGADVHQPTNRGTLPVWIAAAQGHTDATHTLLKAGANARTATSSRSGTPALHAAAMRGHLPVVRVLAESWPLDRRPWKMFLMGGGAASELQDYLAPPANRTTRNFLPRLYSKPDMMKEIWRYLHKPSYVDVGQRDGQGRTAARVATAHGNYGVASLLYEAAWAVPRSLAEWAEAESSVSEEEEVGDGEETE